MHILSCFVNDLIYFSANVLIFLFYSYKSTSLETCSVVQVLIVTPAIYPHFKYIFLMYHSNCAVYTRPFYFISNYLATIILLWKNIKDCLNVVFLFHSCVLGSGCFHPPPLVLFCLMKKHIYSYSIPRGELNSIINH